MGYALDASKNERAPLHASVPQSEKSMKGRGNNAGSSKAVALLAGDSEMCRRFMQILCYPTSDVNVPPPIRK